MIVNRTRDRSPSQVRFTLATAPWNHSVRLFGPAPDMPVEHRWRNLIKFILFDLYRGCGFLCRFSFGSNLTVAGIFDTAADHFNPDKGRSHPAQQAPSVALLLVPQTHSSGALGDYSIDSNLSDCDFVSSGWISTTPSVFTIHQFQKNIKLNLVSSRCAISRRPSSIILFPFNR